MDQDDLPPSRRAAAHTHLTERGQRDAEERRQRQAQALRANLARRKAQGRARSDGPFPGDKSPEPLADKD